MAGELSDYGEVLGLNAIFRDFNIYVGLATSTITDTDGIADIAEVSDANYSRNLVSFSIPAQESGKGTIKNSGGVEFGPWAAEQVDAVSYVFLTDSNIIGEGNIVAYAELPSAKSPKIDELILLRAEDLVIQMN